MSVNGLGLGSRSKEARRLRVSFLVRLGREGQVFAVGLRFACESFP